MIQVEHITKQYGKEFKAVDDISFSIEPGEIVGFVGQNGAGKTTTIKMLTNPKSNIGGKTMAERFEITDMLNQPMNDYSHGMRQKRMICAALIHNPPVWILDEPMTGLDPKAAYELKNMMREHAKEGNCVFFSTHVLEVAEQLCDRIIIIRHGSLVFTGTLDELRTEYPDMTLEQIFLQINGELQEETVEEA